jgi:ribosomal protein S18 acetylase RimI-like enzyme
MTLAVSPASEADLDAIVALWTACGLTRSWNDPRADIALARNGDNATILVGRDGGTIIATAMVGNDGHRGWVYYVAVAPEAQGRGDGRAIMRAAEQWLAARGVAKIMLMIRPDNENVRAFYEALGYFDQPRAVLAKWLDGRDATL